MIYWYKKEIDVPGFECEKKIFVFKEEENGQLVSTSDVVNNPDLFHRIKNLDGVKVLMTTGINVPLIVVEDSIGGDITSVVTNVNKFLSNGNDPRGEECKEYVKKLTTAVTGMIHDEQRAKKIVMAAVLEWEWEHTGKLQTAFMIDSTDYDYDLMTYTTKALGELNNVFLQAINSISIASNNTEFQNECTDKLFIEIPSRQVLLNAESVYALVPKMDEVCKPYCDSAAYTAAYKSRIIGSSGLIQDIEGDRKNNTATIYENEQEYFTALDEWVRFNMKEHYGNSDGDVIDQDSQTYLFNVITMLYILHWRHSVNVPDAIDESVNEDADYLDRYVFGTDKASGINAVIVLKEFLKEVSAEIGYKAYIYAVVQMARWGSRKPTALVFDGISREFDLVHGMSRTRLGNLQDYKLVKSNGKDSRIIGAITETKDFKDASISFTVKNPIIGVITETRMADVNGGEIQLLMYYHFIDFVPLVESGAISVDGVQKANGKWVVTEGPDFCMESATELINLYNQMKNEILQFPFYRSEKLVEHFAKTSRNTTGMLQNFITIMNTRVSDPGLAQKAEMAKIHTYEDAVNLVADQRNPLTSTSMVMEYAIVDSVLPVYKSFSTQDNTTVSDAMNAWDYALKEFEGLPLNRSMKLEAPTSFGKAPQMTIEQQEQATQTPQAPQMTIEQQEQMPASDWYKVVPASVPVNPIVSSSGKVVAYCYTESGIPQQANSGKTYTRYTVVANPGNHPVNSEIQVHAYRIFALVLHNIELSSLGSVLRQVFFENSTAINTFKQAVQALSKTERW